MGNKNGFDLCSLARMTPSAKQDRRFGPVWSLSSGVFMKSFMTLNIINFADVAKKDKIGVSWDVSRVSSP